MVKVAKEFNILCISCKFLSFLHVMEFGTNAFLQVLQFAARLAIVSIPVFEGLGFQTLG